MITVYTYLDSEIFELSETIKRINEDYSMLKAEISDMKSALSISGRESKDSLTMALDYFLMLRSSFSLLKSELDHYDRSLYRLDMLSKLDRLCDEERAAVRKEIDEINNSCEPYIESLNSLAESFEGTFSSADGDYSEKVFSLQ